MQHRGVGSFAQRLQNQGAYPSGTQGTYQAGYGQQQGHSSGAYRAGTSGPQTQSTRRSVGASVYTPTSYDAPNAHGIPPEQFYGA